MELLNATQVPIMLMQFLDGMGLLEPTVALFTLAVAITIFKMLFSSGD